MKKHSLILAALLLLTMTLRAIPVNIKTAQKVAETFMQAQTGKRTTLQTINYADRETFTNFYVFGTENSFVIVSADDCVQPILGYSTETSFGTERMPENVFWWLKGYDDQISDAARNRTNASDAVAKEWRELTEGNGSKAQSDVVVEPLVQTLWNQYAPYSNLCPSASGITGCVATAMAQVMKRWSYPTTGVGSHSYTPENHPEYGEQSANFGETTYDWANMKDSYSSSYSDAEALAVATLMYHCGVSVDMNYGTSADGGSGAVSALVPTAWIQYFRYAPSARFVSRSSYSDSQWLALLKLELDEQRPLFYSGRYITADNKTGGHAFVCDGYRSDDYFHFNWGWGGNKNGYYAIGALNPNPGSAGAGSGSGTYNLDNAVVAWAEPISELAAPTLSVAAADQQIHLSWNAVDGAVSYVLYKDNTIIANDLTSTSYDDSNIESGAYYEYYVRAVSSETRSNPSNFVTGMTVYRDIAPSNLTAATSENEVLLNWTGYEGGSSIELHYAVESSGYAYGSTEDGGEYTPTYWAQRYPASLLANLIGMEINKVSACFYFASDYDFYVYNGGLTEADKIHSESFTKASASLSYTDFVFDTPLQIDCTKDLWIVFHNSDASIRWPALVGDYSSNDTEGKYISSSLNDLATNVLEAVNLTWLFRVSFTDGTYTYNLYDNGTEIVTNLSETNYTVSSPADNTVHQYTVKTNYYGGESEASNKAGIALGTASLASLELNDNDKMTLAENSTLTISGTLSNGNAANLILEDGAQLIHNSTGVKATVKKHIAPYTSNNDGWNFIASPVAETLTPNAANGLLTSSTYDLYYYEEPTCLWKNYKSNTFDLLAQKGYLYANETGTTLQFAGTLSPSNNNVTITELSHSASTLNGFNLVGNPFPCNATIDQDCYMIDGNHVVLASDTKVFAPCEGAFVKATSDEFVVTFTKSAESKGNSTKDYFDIVVTQDKANVDRARVRFGEGINMDKYTLDDNNTQLAFWQDGERFAVIYSDGQDELPLNFKTQQDGSYTLNLETLNANLDYLHLIDNLTGNDIDLLATPNYTFEAKASDYASRFRLVFSSICEDADDDDALAFIDNGNIVINNRDASNASLQVIDMTGHVVFCTDGVHTVSTDGMPAGVYVLRLVSNGDVKTQKIVIE